MNRLTKQLLSLGLSVVTVAGMVSPVLADDEVSITETETTEVAKQTTDVEQPSEEVVNQPTGDAQVPVESNNDTVEYVVDVYLDGKQEITPTSIQLSKDWSELEVKNYIEENYAYGRIIVSLKSEENPQYPNATYYVLNLETPKEVSDDYKIILNVNGVETTQNVHLTEDDFRIYGTVYQYIKLKCIPDGYHIDYTKGKDLSRGIVLSGSNTYRAYLLENSKPTSLKKYTVKVLKAERFLVDEFENASVEYNTIEYDSEDRTGIEDYIIKTCLPKGYIVNESYALNDIYQLDDSTYCMVAYKIQNNEEIADPRNWTTYHFIYVDENGNTVTEARLDTLIRKDNCFTLADNLAIPKGYKTIGDTFYADGKDADGFPIVKVKLEKGEQKTAITYRLYKSADGTNVKFKTVNVFAQDIDTNKNGIIDDEELETVVPKGYKNSGLSPQAGGVPYQDSVSVQSGYKMSLFLEELFTVTKPSDSNEAASITGVDTTEKLANSLNAQQQVVYDEAVKEGKKIEFKPVVKDEIKASDEKLLLAYADDEDTEVVNAFDIEIELVIDDKKEGNISETAGKLTFQVAIPETLKKDGRKFYVLRAHDGKVEKLPVNEDGTFETDKFSSYMLVYEDEKAVTPETKPEVKPEEKPEVKPETKPEVKPETKPEVKPETNTETKPEVKPAAKPSTGSTTTTTDTKKNNTVKKDVKKNKKVNTSTKTSSTLFTGLLGASIVGLGAVEVLRRRNK